MARRPAEHFPSTTREQLPRKHLDILRAAMRLMADRGFAGASLREVAKRVGMSQPSLYHYFKSKDELVEQILLHLGSELLFRGGFEKFPETLEDVADFLVDYVLRLYDDPDYVVFIRFMINIAPGKPKYRAAVRRIYEDSFNIAVPALLAPFIERGDVSEAEAKGFVRMCLNAMALLLIERRVIYVEKNNSEDLMAYAEFCKSSLRFLAREKFSTGKRG